MKTTLRKAAAFLLTIILAISFAPFSALAAVIDYSNGISLLGLIEQTPVDTYIFYSDGTQAAKQMVKDQETLLQPASPTKDGYKFLGWYTAQEDGDLFTGFGPVSVGTGGQTISLYAHFAQVYYVFFMDQDGRIYATKEGVSGTAITVNDIIFPVAADQCIVGWFTDASLNNEVKETLVLKDTNVTLYPKVGQGHWITYAAGENASYIAPVFVKYGAGTVCPDAPVRLGYTFDGWYDGAAKYSFGVPLTEDKTLTAAWNAQMVNYQVFYWQENPDDDNYTFMKSVTEQAQTGTTTNVIVTDDYNGFAVQAPVQQMVKGDGSTIVNVYYDRIVYTVSFREYTMVSGGHRHTYDETSGKGKNKVYKGGCYGDDWRRNPICGLQETEGDFDWAEITALNITDKYGANISNDWPSHVSANYPSTWAVAPDSNIRQCNIDTMPLGGAVFYKLRETTSNIEKAYYYLETLPGASYSGGIVNAGGITYYLDHTDTAIGKGLTVTEEDRYPITGFSCNTKYSPKNGDGYNDKKFFYSRLSFDISFVNAGVNEKTISRLYQQDISDVAYTPIHPAGVPEAYVFSGWFTGDNGTGSQYTFKGKTMPAVGITVYAYWAAPVVRVTAYANMEGTTIAPNWNLKEFMYGTKLNQSDMPVVKIPEGNAWRSWAVKSGNMYTPYNFDTILYTDLVLYPYYTSTDSFCMIYNACGGSGDTMTDTAKYAQGSYAEVKNNAYTAPEGKVFLCWNTAENGTGTRYYPKDKVYITGNITLYAVWVDKEGTTSITYKPNNGTGEKEVTYSGISINDKHTLIDNCFTAPAGCTFKGWSTETDGSIIPAGTSVILDNNGENVVYAIWMIRTDMKYSVHFYYMNADGTYPEEANETVNRTGTFNTVVCVKDEDKANRNLNDVKYIYDENNENEILEGKLTGEDNAISLRLYFRRETASYVIHHYLLGTQTKVADDEQGMMTIDGTLTANARDDKIDGYTKAVPNSYVPGQSITIKDTGNEIIVYYTIPLTFTAENGRWVYDGNSHTQPDFTVAGLVNGDEKKDFNVKMTVESAITNVGNQPNVIDSISINGDEIPPYYSVNKQNGNLEVIPLNGACVTIIGNSEMKTYDGKAHKATGYTVLVNNALYKETDFTFSGKAEAERIDAGTTNMNMTVDQFANINKNFTDVVFQVVDGFVTIEPITEAIMITANSDKKTYDGTALTNSGFTYTQGVLAEGDVLTAVITGSTTNAGTEDNKVTSYTVMHGDRDVTTCYTGITTADGLLEVTPRSVMMTSADDKKVYDGTTLINEKVMVTGDGFAEGEGATYMVTGSQTKADTSDNTFTYTLNEGVKESNYVIETEFGKLQVTKRPVTVRVITDRFDYDGAPHSVIYAADAANEESGLADTDTLTAVLQNAARTEIGSNEVDFIRTLTVIWNASNESMSDSYTITYAPGMITINSVPVTYTVEYYYDGILNAALTETAVADVQAVISSYTDKPLNGMELRSVQGIPLQLKLKPEENVIRVYYETANEIEEIEDIDVPLAGSMIGLTAGDCIE